MNKGQVRISVVIITFNEEKNIERCLESVKDIADEIIIIDSNSTDRTKEICQKHNAQFIQMNFMGYSETKNHGNSLAKHDYILSIDADEALSEELKQSITDIKQNAQLDAYKFNRLTNYCGKWVKHCGWYPDRKLRIWKKDLGKWTGDIHEKVDLQSNSIGFLKGDLYHYSYYSIKDHINQVNTFTEIASNTDFQAGKEASLVKILINPAWKFVRDYVFKLGFLDGYIGFVICMISAHATFIKYVKIRQLKKNNT